MALTFQPLLGFANPDVPTLKHGLAEFPEPGLADFVIHQTSDRVIIDWESFSIATGESTRFVQPGSGSAALNRVTSGAPSELHGALSANGRVLLINPNGILIGPGGRIDTAGFLASTLDLSDADFLAGGDLHFAGDSIASVVNFGTITSIDGGDIFLIGKQVENHGSLTSSEGSVGLAGASEVTILASGEERIMIEPDGLSGSVTNSGAIAAATAELRAAGGNEYALALNNTGMVRARSIENRGGRVILSVGGGGGRLVNDGEVRASNSVTVTHSGEAGSDGGVEIGGTVVARDETTGNGGAIVVSGPQVNIGTGGVLDASGSEAGTILITGEDAVTIDGSLAANGEAGNGGVIQVLGGDAGSVTVGGTVEAKGSADGGVIIFDAPTLTLNATSRIDASGAVNGGSIQVIGGDEGTVRVDGQLNASGGSGDGGSILLSGGDVALAASGGLDASGGADGGYIQIESAGSTVVEGSVRAVGGNGSGGRVEVLGETVSLGATALIDASGASGGGAVFVGGGREGGDASLRNANNTTVANGARIVANATGSGDGGTVILWADEAMDFRGAVENRGAGDGLGGFTEVSGLQQLGFNGTVDTGGGDLLLDPFNYVIGATEAANLAFLLGLNHITINTTMASPTFGSGAGPADPGEDGDITVNANVFYDSTFDLTLLAQGDVKFNASVQNRNASGGDINIVAGWDGTTAFNAAAFAGEDVGVTTVFGNGAGSILIGDGTQIGGVAVGSRSGTTRAFGHDVTLQGSDTTNYAFSHLGFQVSNGIAQDGTNLGIAPVVDGAITIHAKHDLRASGGGKLQTYAQVGHVGADYSNDATIEATATSVIEVATGNDIIFLGGGLDSYGQYAQLGQGGASAAGSFSGATTITTANNIIFSGGGDLAYAQLGQGGYFALGNHDGTTTIITANDVTFTGGGGYHPFQVGRYAYAQLGQGGMFAYGNHSGTTTITSANHISFSGGDGEQAYAQLGQGGRGAIGNHDGTTTITTASDIRFSGGGGNSSHAQLGQGGVSGSHSGLIDVTHRGDLILAGQNVSSQYALIGHGDGPGDTDAGHTVDGVITIDTGGNVTVTNGWLGHLLDADGASNSGDMTVTANGDITLNSHVNQGGYDTASTYSYLAGGDVNFHASVQNRNAGGGDINIVAGRDGTTPFDAAAFTAEDVNAAATLFGNNSKSIHIGDGAQTTGIAVGSRSGTTRAFGHDVVLHGSNTTSNAFAQLGFQVTDGIAQDGTNLGIAPLVDGAITVHAKHDLSATAGNLTRVAYVQVGHVGADIAGGTTVEATASSVIEVAAGNDIVFLGDGVGGYAQLGQGGYLARGNHSGTTTITTANDIIFSGGDGFSYAQLGQGGFSAVGNHSGMITITDANDLIFSGGGGSRAYAQLGHGGVSSSGDQSGAIVAGLAGNLLLKSGSGSQAYAMIGHGDAGASTIGNRMGNIDLRVAGESSLVNNADTSNHRIWMIGHRSTGIVSMADILFLTGTLDYDDTAVAPNTTLGQDFADKFATNLAGGNVTIGSTGAVMGNSMEVNGVFDYNSANTLNLLAALKINFNASVQNRRAIADGQAVNVAGGWDAATGLTATPGTAPLFTYNDVFTTPASFGNNGGGVRIGDGAQTTGIAVGNRSGATNLAAASLTLRASDTTNSAFAQLGHRPTADGQASDGAINVRLKGDLTATGGAEQNAYAQVGHGGRGFLAMGSNANHAGAITIDTGAKSGTPGNITFTGDGGTSYAQLGHGGWSAEGNHSGDITITRANDLSFTAGGGDAYAKLGHGGAYAAGNHSGAITIIAANDLSFAGGLGSNAYAQLGHGGFQADGDHSGAITITKAGDLIFIGHSAGNRGYAQLGHGGIFARGDHSGAITITEANDLIFTAGGAGGASFAQLGHGGQLAGGNHSGAITITAVSDLKFTGGEGPNAFAQLGHGGMRTPGSHSGAITVTVAHDANFTAGEGNNSFAQLGHGGALSNGSFSGDITVNLTGGFALTGQDTIRNHALIGHGDEPGDGDAGDIISGDVMLRAKGSGTLSNAFIGHQIDADGSYTDGNTFIGVGQDGFVPAGTASLRADAASLFNSAPGGELRFYLPERTGYQIADGTLLNGTAAAAPGTAPLPNEQGSFRFGNGPYHLSAPGNFAFYLAPSAPAGGGGPGGGTSGGAGTAGAAVVSTAPGNLNARFGADFGGGSAGGPAAGSGKGSANGLSNGATPSLGSMLDIRQIQIANGFAAGDGAPGDPVPGHEGWFYGEGFATDENGEVMLFLEADGSLSTQGDAAE